MVAIISTAIAGVISAGTAVPVAVTGAVTATTAATTVASSAVVPVSGGAIVAGVLSGPIGWIVLGTTENQFKENYSFDCWKPILHDKSNEPSNGKLLRDIFQDSRIKQVIILDNNENSDLPNLIVENIWNERFRIEYVQLPNNRLAAHAVKLD